MTKSDLSEIKKRYKPEKANDNTVFRIAGCYVGGDGEIRSTFSQNFQSLDETETFKYFEIFKKTLSGQDGKNAVTLQLTEESEEARRSLLALKESRLGYPDMLNAFYRQVTENLQMDSNYAIFVIDDSYDIPVKTKDKMTNDIESDEVYHYILCCICPVASEKAGLFFDGAKFSKLEQRMVVEDPVLGFLYPAFNNRSSDDRSIMYYTKKPDADYSMFVQNVFQVKPVMNAKAQKEAFQTVIEDTFADSEKGYEIISRIHENLSKMEEAHKLSENNSDPLTLQKEDIKKLFSQSGASNKVIENEFEKAFSNAMGENAELVAKNIHNSKAYEVKSPDVVVKIKTGCGDIVQTKELNGKKCLVIEIADNVEIEGIDVKL